VLRFINEASGKVGKREIARAFQIKGAQRSDLKQLLSELEADGALVKGRRKSFTNPDRLPPVGVIDIFDRDEDGHLVARPAKWDAEGPAPLITLVEHRRSRGPTLGIGDRVLARLKLTDNSASPNYEARAIKKLDIKSSRVLGIFNKTKDGGRITALDRRRKADIFVSAPDTLEAKQGELVLVQSEPAERYGPPRGVVKARIGLPGDPKTISLLAIQENELPVEFSADALREAEEAKPATLGSREDIRDIPIVTIDPKDAKDFDDAVWAQRDTSPGNKGGFNLIVAIADVAHYVHPGSALDRDAYKRGNSAYFPDRVVPMLPERLSNELCSLRPHEERPCLGVKITIDKDGNKKGHTFFRGLMKSAARLSYEQAQDVFDGKKDADVDRAIQENVLTPVWEAYQALARARDKRSPLDLDLPEFRVDLGDDGGIKSISPRQRLEAHRLIEEFMILANVCAAETLVKKNGGLMLRAHEPPANAKFIELSDYLTTIGLPKLAGKSLKTTGLNRVLTKADDLGVKEIVSEVVLRSQSQAYYTPELIGHFGLNLSKYAHFTSPIRRYADLIVHRALIRVLGFGEDGLTDQEEARLLEIGEHISQTERRAMAAERATNDRFVSKYMGQFVGAEFDARISSTTRFGLFIRLNKTGADGLIPMRTLPGGYFTVDEKTQSIFDRATGLTFRTGDPIRAKLVEATPLTGGLRFELIDGGQIEKKNKGRGRPSSGGKRRRRG